MSQTSKLAENPPKGGKHKKQTCNLQFWGDIGIEKWSPFFCFVSASEVPSFVTWKRALSAKHLEHIDSFFHSFTVRRYRQKIVKSLVLRSKMNVLEYDILELINWLKSHSVQFTPSWTLQSYMVNSKLTLTSNLKAIFWCPGDYLLWSQTNAFEVVSHFCMFASNNVCTK